MEEELDLNEIVFRLWKDRVLIIKISIISLLVSVAITLLLPNRFTAEVVISPTEDDASKSLGGAGALLSQFGGIAGLGLGSTSKVAESVATLRSAALIETFINESNLLPILFKSRWDEEGKHWKEGLLSRDPPTLWKAEQLFSDDVLSIKEDRKTGLLTLTIEWTNPELAALWANEIVARGNHYLRARAIDLSEKNLVYLNQQLEKTSVVELQSSIYSLIELEIKKIMIARSNEEYAFKVVDPARVPEEKSSPKRVLISLLGLFLGFCAGSMWVLFKANRKDAY